MALPGVVQGLTTSTHRSGIKMRLDQMAISDRAIIYQMSFLEWYRM